jgi:hypothetical protein
MGVNRISTYMLITGLGLGGRGHGDSRGAGRGEAPSVPARPEEHLNFLPSPEGFRQRDSDWKPVAATKVLTLEEVVARVKEGGRSDLSLKISGDAVQRAVDAALAAFKRHGIDVLVETAASAPARVSGNARGRYGRCRAGRWEVRR